MNQAGKSCAATMLPVNPDSLLAEHFERHIHLYHDVSMFIACLLIFSATYCTADMLSVHFW